jgi:carbonic anhydrase
VKHIIVCGHYGCGGVKAAMTQKSFGIINKWLRNIKDVYRFHRDEIDGIQDEQKRFDRLTELNVKEQIHNLAKTSIIQKAWINRQGPTLHGWVYRLDDGILNNILTIDHTFNVDPIYRFDEDELKDL